MRGIFEQRGSPMKRGPKSKGLTVQFVVRLTQEQAQLVKEEAAARGLSAAGWIRELLEAKTGVGPAGVRRDFAR